MEKKVYAQISWTPEDVIEEFPGWGLEKATRFLEEIEESLVEAMCSEGWATIRTLGLDNEEGEG